MPDLDSKACVSIREAAQADAGFIAGLISQLGYPTVESEMAERLARVRVDPNYRTLVAEVDASRILWKLPRVA